MTGSESFVYLHGDSPTSPNEPSGLQLELDSIRKGASRAGNASSSSDEFTAGHESRRQSDYRQGVSSSETAPHLVLVSQSFSDKMQTIASAGLAAGLGTDNFISNLQKAGRIPHVPDRKPDITTAAGAKIWKRDGHVEALELGTGPLFSFSYKHGELSRVIEPDGAKVSHRDKGDQWIKQTADNKQKIAFYGSITPLDNGNVVYSSDAGEQLTYNANGYCSDVYQGKLLKLVDPGNHEFKFEYDAAGNPTKVVNPDGSIIFAHADGHLYRHFPGVADAEPTSYTSLSRDRATGDVVLQSQSGATVYSPDGIKVIARPQPAKDDLST